jgi:hypothetical protein
MASQLETALDASDAGEEPSYGEMVGLGNGSFGRGTSWRCRNISCHHVTSVFGHFSLSQGPS